MGYAELSTDVAVIGAGAAGLACAVALKSLGVDTAVFEKTSLIGGTTAASGGSVWIPLTRQALDAGMSDTSEAAATYLDAVIGEWADPSIRAAFLAKGPEALAFFEQISTLAFKVRRNSPDYHQEEPGATDEGRVLDVNPFDARLIGAADLGRLRRPLPDHMWLGGMMLDRTDLLHLLSGHRSLKSAFHTLKLLLNYFRDRIHYPRGTRLVHGNAFMGHLIYSVRELAIDLHLDHSLESVTGGEGGVRRLQFATPGGKISVTARQAIVFASGGFSRNPQMVDQVRRSKNFEHYSMCSEGATGDGIRLGVRAGGHCSERYFSGLSMAPVSVMPDDPYHRFPHLVMDRQKPGVIAVNSAGCRFTNEADSYHRFGLSMYDDNADADANSPAWLIIDAKGLRRYGLGRARPGPSFMFNHKLARSGYLIKASSLEILAGKIGVPVEPFLDTIATHNEGVTQGTDVFGKGSNSYNRALGDPGLLPANPCLAPIKQAPFFAIKIHSGDLGSARGLVTDAQTRVLDVEGNPLEGLHAIGLDMQSMTGGTYPGPGITLGPILTFAYIAARKISRAV